MQRTIQAIYEGGVLRPLEPLLLLENELVSLAIERQSETDEHPVAAGNSSADEWLDADAVASSRLLADPTISLDDVRQALSGIKGDLADAVSQQRGDY
jgi:predicted DNA-binding antitoxin AbrB/MazE fold protein